MIKAHNLTRATRRGAAAFIAGAVSLGKNIGERGFYFLTGLGSLGVGLWFIAVELSLVVIGAILIAVAVWGPYIGGARDQRQ